MANSEDIEARLCAYIEGELSPNERAEIERHLQGHPGHRQMMQDLARTRNLMGELPRMNAPGDLSEGLHAHLERSMLLGKGLSGDEAGPGWRSHFRRSATVAILAAVCVLTVGFGSLVYYMIHVASHPVDVATAVVQTPAPAKTPPVVDSPPPVVALSLATRPSDTQPSQSSDEDVVLAQPPTTQESPPTTQEAVADAPTTQQAGPTTLPSGATADLGNSAIPADFPSPPVTQPSVDVNPPTTAPVADDADGK